MAMIDNEDKNLVEKKISSEKIFDGVLLHVFKDEVELPNGNTATREWIKHPGAAAVIPILPDNEIILVRQFRYPVGQVTLEVPAGKLDKPNEDPVECAKRELSEETGYTTENIWKLTTIATTVGFTNEVIHLFAASDLKLGEQHTDTDEFINVVKVPLTAALHMVETGKIIDAKSIISILLLAQQIFHKK
ncbi:MAG: NUDIX hydrolase [Selenomonadaceae bacterium]|nr:NUDIX hydrolase [Selenomonadaceae bacterium]